MKPHQRIDDPFATRRYSHNTGMNSQASLLSLPPNIRMRIYQDAVHSLTLEWYKHDNPYQCYRPNTHLILDGQRILHSSQKPTQFRAAKGLLLSCRSINSEVTQLLYFNKHVFARVRSHHDLQAFENLRPSTLSHITTITVVLNERSCFSDGGWAHCSESSKPCKYRKDDSVISRRTPELDALLMAWARALQYIFKHTLAGKLKLFVICDIESAELAELVLRPIMNTTSLADCAIRLNCGRNIVLQKMAYDAMLHATSQKPPAEVMFRYLDLPTEVRRRILHYTDLVTPYREVEWNPDKGFDAYSGYEGCKGVYCPLPRHYGCQFFYCGSSDQGGCFCLRYHSASTRRCYCWLPPKSLFLVCQTMKEEAEATFYSMNRFIILPKHGPRIPPQENPQHFEASKFISTRLHVLHHLRRVEIVVPPFESGYCTEDSLVAQDWQNTIKRASALLNCPKLTLHVIAADHDGLGGTVTPFRANMTAVQSIEIDTTYRLILRPLANLSGLRRLYVSLTFPFEWTRAFRDKDVGFYDRQSQRRSYNEQIGREVMGEEYEELTQGQDYNRLTWCPEDQDDSSWAVEQLYEGSYGDPVLFNEGMWTDG